MLGKYARARARKIKKYELHRLLCWLLSLCVNYYFQLPSFVYKVYNIFIECTPRICGVWCFITIYALCCVLTFLTFFCVIKEIVSWVVCCYCFYYYAITRRPRNCLKISQFCNFLDTQIFLFATKIQHITFQMAPNFKFPILKELITTCIMQIFLTKCSAFFCALQTFPIRYA